MALNLSSQVAAANALPYATSPFSQGFTVEDYRARYREHGETVRWWKAVEAGVSYIEQELDAAVRVVVLNDSRDLKHPDFGQLTVGDLKHCGVPDEIFLAPYDRVLYPKRWRPTTHTGEFEDDELTLPRLLINSVQQIYSGSTLVAPDDYTLTGRVIRWIGAGAAPENPRILYRFTPQYEFRGEGDREPFHGADAGMLPQIVPLFLLAEGDEIE